MLENKKKSIFFYTVSHPMFGIGGAEIQSYYYAKAFAEQGWKTYFISSLCEIKTDEFNIKNIHLLLYNRTNNSIKETYYVLKYLARFKPSYVFYRYIRYQYGFIVFFGRLFFNCKFIFSTMSDELCGKHASTITRRKQINRKKPIYQYLYRIKYWLQDKIFYFGVYLSHLHIVQNNFQLEKMKQDFKKNGFIIHNNTLIPEYLNTRKNLVLFIATMKFMKRPEIFCKLANKHKNSNCRYVIIGSNYSDDKMAINFSNLVKTSNIDYLGAKPLSEVQQILSKSKLLINTSSYEGFPNTFVQAWARGVPVISLSVDPDNIIKNNHLGISCDNDFNKLVDNTEKLLNDNILWNKLSRNCYNYALKNLNTNIIVKKIINIIQSN